jgi:hypothetical protein
LGVWLLYDVISTASLAGTTHLYVAIPIPRLVIGL